MNVSIRFAYTLVTEECFEMQEGREVVGSRTQRRSERRVDLLSLFTLPLLSLLSLPLSMSKKLSLNARADSRNHSVWFEPEPPFLRPNHPFPPCLRLIEYALQSAIVYEFSLLTRCGDRLSKRVVKVERTRFSPRLETRGRELDPFSPPPPSLPLNRFFFFRRF